MPDEFRLTNATLVLPDRLVPNGEIHIRDGRIAAIGEMRGLPQWKGATHDARGQYAAPGFVDMHVHGGDGADFMDGSVEAFETVIRAHARHGTTGIAPTTTVARHDQTLQFLRTCRELKRRGPQPRRGLSRVVGAHFYGPYFNEDRVGCHPKSDARPPTKSEYEQYLEFADVILTATCAPELSGSSDFFRAAAAKGIRLNVGHSEADWTEMAIAHELGVRHVDHLYCAHSSVSSLRSRFGTPMRPSILEFALATADVTVEIIADGKHLSPELLRFALTMKGADRCALVTDCSRALDMPEGRYIFGPLDGGEPFIHQDGVGMMPDGSALASSVRGMDFMVRHMHQVVGVDVPTAIGMASLTPARIMGLQEQIGSLEAGKLADVLLLDHDLQVSAMWVGGEGVQDGGSI